MIKRVLSVVFTLALSVAAIGCVSGSSNSTQPDSQQNGGAGDAPAENKESDVSPQSSSDSSLFTAEEWPQNAVTEGVPTPHFSVGMESLSVSDNTVQADWANVSEAEASSYVDEVKRAGFDYEANESKSSSLYSYSAWAGEDVLNVPSVILTYTDDGRFSIVVTNYAA